MAIYHCSIKPVQRSKGRTSTAAAAYRSGEVLHDVRTGLKFDYSRKSDVNHVEIFNWNLSREELWNAAELAEKRKDGKTAVEYEIALPIELANSEKIELAREYSKWLAKEHSCSVDLAVHDVDGKNPHAHILTTTRESTGYELGEKIAREWNGTKRKKHGLPPSKTDLINARKKLSELTNKFLNDPLKHESKDTYKPNKKWVDHRSHKDRGMYEIPQTKEGKNGSKMATGERKKMNDQIKKINDQLKKLEEEMAADRKAFRKLVEKIKADSDAARDRRLKEFYMQKPASKSKLEIKNPHPNNHKFKPYNVDYMNHKDELITSLYVTHDKINAYGSDPAENAKHTISEAKENGWKSITSTGNEEYVKASIKEAVKEGVFYESDGSEFQDKYLKQELSKKHHNPDAGVKHGNRNIGKTDSEDRGNRSTSGSTHGRDSHSGGADKRNRDVAKLIEKSTKRTEERTKEIRKLSDIAASPRNDRQDKKKPVSNMQVRPLPNKPRN